MISVATEHVTQPSYCLSFLLCKGGVQNMPQVIIWLSCFCHFYRGSLDDLHSM